MIDPRAIRFSMPTISNDAAPVEPVGRRPRESDVVFHEDEWRQIEFFSPDRLQEIRRKLTELKAFEAEHRTQHGWTRIYVRELLPSPVLPGADAVNSLSRLLDAQVEAAPVLFSGANAIVGRVRDGFTLRLGSGAALYGFRDQTGIQVLGASMQHAEDRLLTDAFSTLNRANRLVLVDWRAQMLLMSVEESGQIVAWAP